MIFTILKTYTRPITMKSMKSMLCNGLSDTGGSWATPSTTIIEKPTKRTSVNPLACRNHVSIHSSNLWPVTENPPIIMYLVCCIISCNKPYHADHNSFFLLLLLYGSYEVWHMIYWVLPQQSSCYNVFLLK